MLVVATAGHVDHGKSSLLRALTGDDPDRLDEERRRGLTLDLGFVSTRLPRGEVAFVDVPGHQRFIANTLAGIATAPAVLFVVAADGGWMPQSAEHLAAIEAFGVRTGLLAVTRADCADPAPALAEAREQLAGSGLAAAESVVVSARTGTGLDELRRHLDALRTKCPAPGPDAPVRLWLDRVFTADGAGTVGTGTLTAGRLAVGDELELAPGGRRVTVRGLQCLGSATDAVTAPARVAVNLRRVSRGTVKRGNSLVTPGGWWTAGTVDVRLPAGAAALPAEPLIHCGTAVTTARVRPLGREAARLRLRTPLPLHIGDRLLVRDPGSRRLTGAVVLDVDPPELARRGAAAARAEQLAGMTGGAEPAALLRRAGVVHRDALRAMGVRLPPAAAAGGSAVLGGTGNGPAPAAGIPHGTVTAQGWLVDPEHAGRLRDRLAEAVSARAAEHPLGPGLPVAEAQRVLGLPDPALVEALAGERFPVRTGRLHRAQEGDRLPPPVRDAARALLRDFRAAPFAAPTEARLRELGLTRPALALLVREGWLARFADVWLPHDAADRAADRLRGLEAPFSVGECCRVLGTSRRVAVPLLEHLDRLGATRRDGSGRRTLGGA